ncbi:TRANSCRIPTION ANTITERMINATION PROTEIN [Mycoplasmopsis pulmonis]|uniref:Transcription termination/antitermination protein NusG n=1 Tax=Mycoplasmopsis pulmonis (strain UAB CTIP) TaxID=272635 RepID=Q98R28_MYCPU|nr:transcription termination/antitermination protein NusG [Mycoplasmopsis pulmonis]CAC13355.1 TRANSCRIPTION ANTITERMINATION PROTEIN [Mycoplasmopsis pulmonis]VEU67946.1 Transcription antitermination protein nusG [Mycoplasmopsis pulmonis]
MNKFNWYMISTIPNKEKEVIEAIKNKVVSENLEAYFSDFKIFWESRISAKELEKKQAGDSYKTTKKNMYNGYIFIEMVITNETWFLVRNTENVSGLVGSHGLGAWPTPISKLKFKKMIEEETKKEEEFQLSLNLSKFREGLFVKIVDGPFKNDEIVYKIKKTNHEKKYSILEIESLGKSVDTQIDHKHLKLIEDKE